jgi:TfoX/Sxy family transcriptional regulator of competence genes
MFGGIAFMVNGKMCIGVGRDRCMFRIDPSTHDKVVKSEGCQTVVMKGRPLKGYVHVDASAMKSARQLTYWIDLALDYNRRLAASG